MKGRKKQIVTTVALAAMTATMLASCKSEPSFLTSNKDKVVKVSEDDGTTLFEANCANGNIIMLTEDYAAHNFLETNKVYSKNKFILSATRAGKTKEQSETLYSMIFFIADEACNPDLIDLIPEPIEDKAEYEEWLDNVFETDIPDPDEDYEAFVNWQKRMENKLLESD